MTEELEQVKVWLRFIGGEGAPKGEIGELRLLPYRHLNFSWFVLEDHRMKNPVFVDRVSCWKRSSKNDPLYSVVVPVSNLHGQVVKNCLRSLELQTLESMEIIVVDFGSESDNHKKLLETLDPFDCSVYVYPGPMLWSSTITRNIGIRRAKGKYVGTLDADCILEPGAAEQVVTLLKKRNRMVVQAPCFLPEGIPGDKGLPAAYPLMSIEKSNCKYYGRGIGAYVNAPRTWWFKVHGHDERFIGWGPNDLDLWKRADMDGSMDRVKIVRQKPGRNEPGLSYHILKKDTVCYHQFHEGGRFRRFVGPERFKEISQLNALIHEFDTDLVRNPDGWGIP